MDNLLGFVLFFAVTVAIGIIGSFIATKLRMPGGMMVGAMILVAVFNILTGKGFFPRLFKTFLQVFSGVIIGSRVGKKDLKELRFIIFPTIILLVFMMIMNASLGFLIHKVGGLDIVTSLFSSSPGGLSDMGLLAEDLGANPAYVTLLQLVRVLTIYFFMPPIIEKIFARQLEANKGNVRVPEKKKDDLSKDEKIKRFVLTLIVGAAGGTALYLLKVSSGAMIGSMIAVAAYNIVTEKAYCPKSIRNVTQVGSGCFLGLKIDMESVMGLSALLLPTGIMLLGVIAFAFITAFVINRLTKLDFAVALMASTPGGIQEISLLSEELGTDTPKVAVMQTCRLMFVVSTFPTLIELLSSM
ncbi:MAG: AbrB family transcriptional regulator [Clostridia bacterium]|nr:AbrB family transcriptional regulator [Clostridia bacterium]